MYLPFLSNFLPQHSKVVSCNYLIVYSWSTLSLTFYSRSTPALLIVYSWFTLGLLQVCLKNPQIVKFYVKMYLPILSSFLPQDNTEDSCNCLMAYIWSTPNLLTVYYWSTSSVLEKNPRWQNFMYKCTYHSLVTSYHSIAQQFPATASFYGSYWILAHAY